MEFKSSIGSFTTVNGIRYVVRERSYPKTKTVWDGGVAGGKVYPASEDGDKVTGRNPYKHPNGYWVGVGGATGKSFPDFVKAALYAQKRAYAAMVKARELVQAYDDQLASIARITVSFEASFYVVRRGGDVVSRHATMTDACIAKEKLEVARG